jgi:SAM-dependent methyltransferase
MELKNNPELRDRDKYFEHYTESDKSYMPEEHSWQCEKTLPRLAWAMSVIGKEGFKSVIDLGTKDGYLVLSLSKYNVEAKGIDISRDAIEVARERAKKFNLNVDFQIVMIEDYFDEKKWDCSCLLEVIDRVIDPKVVLDKCREISDNLLLTTPDYYGRFGWDDSRNAERLRIYKEPELLALLKEYGEIKEMQILDGAFFVYLKFNKPKNGKQKN